MVTNTNLTQEQQTLYNDLKIAIKSGDATNVDKVLNTQDQMNGFNSYLNRVRSKHRSGNQQNQDFSSYGNSNKILTFFDKNKGKIAFDVSTLLIGGAVATFVFGGPLIIGIIAAVFGAVTLLAACEMAYNKISERADKDGIGKWEAAKSILSDSEHKETIAFGISTLLIGGAVATFVFGGPLIIGIIAAVFGAVTLLAACEMAYNKVNERADEDRTDKLEAAGTMLNDMLPERLKLKRGPATV